jgi:hypothetical protein
MAKRSEFHDSKRYGDDTCSLSNSVINCSPGRVSQCQSRSYWIFAAHSSVSIAFLFPSYGSACGLLYGTISCETKQRRLVGRPVSDELEINLEGSGRGFIEVLSRHVP